MAELAPSKKYFTLLSIRLTHRAKDDAFHLTAQDEDFPDGFHMTLSSGSNLEPRIRDPLEEQGLLKPAGEASKNLGEAYLAGAKEGEPGLPKPDFDTRPRALFVRSEAVSDALSSLRRDWKFLPAVPDIETVWTGLGGHTVSDNIQCLLITDGFFDPKAGRTEAFENLVVAMAPYCFLGVVSYDKAKQASILEAVGRRALSSGLEGFAPYFFIDPQYPNKSIDEAWPLTPWMRWSRRCRGVTV